MIHTDLDPDDIIAHYRAEFGGSGWHVHDGSCAPGWGSMTWLGGDHYMEITASVDDRPVAEEGFAETTVAVLSIGESDGQEAGDVTPRTCSETETEAITRLAHPAGAAVWAPWGQPAAFPGDDVAGCVTTYDYDLTDSGMTVAQVLDHYGDQLETGGWQVLERTLESADARSDVAIGTVTGSDGETRATTRVVGLTGTGAGALEGQVARVTLVANDESP